MWKSVADELKLSTICVRNNTLRNHYHKYTSFFFILLLLFTPLTSLPLSFFLLGTYMTMSCTEKVNYNSVLQQQRQQQQQLQLQKIIMQMMIFILPKILLGIFIILIIWVLIIIYRTRRFLFWCLHNFRGG